MKLRSLPARSGNLNCTWAALLALAGAALAAAQACAATLPVPNASFESPKVPPVVPYASPEIEAWQKSAQPAWYDPSQNQDTPWAFLSGQFYNAPLPSSFIVNCDGEQAAFFFAVPEVALFQDYASTSGTNTTPDQVFDAVYKPGHAYDLTVGLLGGLGNMQPGVTLELSLYYRDPASNKVTLAATTVTNSPALFPSVTNFVDFKVSLPLVKETDAWAGKHIGIQILSTARFDLAGGYWDIDNVRLAETAPAAPRLGAPGITNGLFTFSVQGRAGSQFEVQYTLNPAANPVDWTRLGLYENPTGTAQVTDTATNGANRYYRVREL